MLLKHVFPLLAGRISGMFEPPADLAPDLEWMLGGDQVSKEMILEALVEEHYSTLYRLALSVLGTQDAAHQATRETIARALTNQYSYREQLGVNTWLYRFAWQSCSNLDQSLQQNFGQSDPSTLYRKFEEDQPLQEEPNPDEYFWQAFDHLNLKDRFCLSLENLFQWSHTDIGRLFDQTGEQIARQLSQARQNLLAELHTMWDPDTRVDEEDFGARFRSSMDNRWPASEIPPETLKRYRSQIASLSVRMSVRRRGISHFKEVLLVLLVILCAAAIIWGSNIFFTNKGDEEIQSPVRRITQLVYVTSAAPIPQPTSTRQKPTSTPTPVPNDIIYQVEYEERFSDIAKRLGVSEGELRWLNRLSPEKEVIPGEQLLVPGRLPGQPPNATPVTPSEGLSPLEDPVSMTDVLTRLRRGGDTTDTLWFEALVVDYGPTGYIGPPKILRTQMWLSETQILVVAGDPQVGPQEVLLWQDRVWHQSLPGEDRPWFATQEEINPDEVRFYTELDRLFNSVFGVAGDLESQRRFQPPERVSWIDQPALLFTTRDPLNNRRIAFWLDDSHAMILRKQWFSTQETNILAQEVAITAVEFDVDFPQDLFDVRLPWRGGFAQDYRGGPESQDGFELPAFIEQGLRKIEPIEPEVASRKELDFASGQLVFAFQDRFHANNLSGTADLYLDRRYLGSTRFGNPWTTICQRSPDGRRLAYVSQPNRDNSPDSQLRWLDLDRENDNVSTLQGMVVTSFAWAPDNRHLAIFGYDPRERLYTGRLIVLDSLTGKIQFITQAYAINSLVWRPDGERLAAVVRPAVDSSEDLIFVLSIEDGRILYRIPLSVESIHENAWWMENWGVEFPVTMDNFESCAAPQ